MTTLRHILSTLLILISLATFGQRKGYIIMDNNGDITNPNISLRDFDVIIEPFNIDSLNTQIFEISWLDFLTEGRFYIRICHNAIYLRQGHDNPNTNSIFWIFPISLKQYSIIKQYLNTRKSDVIQFERTPASRNLQYFGIINSFNSTDISFLTSNRDSLLLNETNRVLSDFNKVLQENEKLPILSTEDLTPRPIYFDKSEIGNRTIKFIEE